MRVLITLFTSSFAGYIFAKYHFKGKNLAFGVILIQIMIPFQVVMIPNYLLVVKFGLIDSLWALIIPSMVDAYGIFMMKQFIESMPAELMDAADLIEGEQVTIVDIDNGNRLVTYAITGARVVRMTSATCSMTWTARTWRRATS